LELHRHWWRRMNVGLAVADFNHDGFKDFAVGNSASSSSFQIFLNNSGRASLRAAFTTALRMIRLKLLRLKRRRQPRSGIRGPEQSRHFCRAREQRRNVQSFDDAHCPRRINPRCRCRDINGDGALDIVSTLYGSKVFAFTANAVAGQGATTQSLLSQIDLKTQANALASLTLAAQAADNISVSRNIECSRQSRAGSRCRAPMCDHGDIVCGLCGERKTRKRIGLRLEIDLERRDWVVAP